MIDHLLCKRCGGTCKTSSCPIYMLCKVPEKSWLISGSGRHFALCSLEREMHRLQSPEQCPIILCYVFRPRWLPQGQWHSSRIHHLQHAFYSLLLVQTFWKAEIIYSHRMHFWIIKVVQNTREKAWKKM